MILSGDEERMTAREKSATARFKKNNLVDVLPAFDFNNLNAFVNVGKKRKESHSSFSSYHDLSYIPASSVTVESLFSMSKYILTDQRRSLLPSTLEILIILKVQYSFHRFSAQSTLHSSYTFWRILDSPI